MSRKRGAALTAAALIAVLLISASGGPSAAPSASAGSRGLGPWARDGIARPGRRRCVVARLDSGSFRRACGLHGAGARWGRMGVIQIRGVSDDAHRRLKEMAAEHGVSLSEFLRGELEEMARG